MEGSSNLLVIHAGVLRLVEEPKLHPGLPEKAVPICVRVICLAAGHDCVDHCVQRLSG